MVSDHIISIKFTEVEVEAKFFKIVCRFLLQIIFWWLQAMFFSNYIIKTSKDKYRYFKCNFDEENNYAHTFEEKTCSAILGKK